MRCTISAILLALVVGIFARPQGGDWSDWSSPDDGSDDSDGSDSPSSGGDLGNSISSTRIAIPSCLSNDDVQTLVNGYTYLLEKPGGPDFNSTANAILSDQFTVWSDSINTLGNRTLGTPAWTSLQMFIATQSLTPPLPTVQTVDMFHNCDHISWRWNATGIQNPKVPVANPVRVQGLITFIVDDNKKIETVYSEFNTAAFLTDLGNPECQQFVAQSK